MDKIKVDIITEISSNEIYISIDHGEFYKTKSNMIIRTLLRLIRNPERYRIDIIEN